METEADGCVLVMIFAGAVEGMVHILGSSHVFLTVLKYIITIFGIFLLVVELDLTLNHLYELLRDFVFKRVPLRKCPSLGLYDTDTRVVARKSDEFFSALNIQTVVVETND